MINLLVGAGFTTPPVTDNSDHPPILADLIGLCCPARTKKQENRR
jgi:hypothetical protein